MKNLPFREKKAGGWWGWGGERTCKVDYNSLFKGFFCLQMVLLKRGSSGYLGIWLKINKEIPGFFRCSRQRN